MTQSSFHTMRILPIQLASAVLPFLTMRALLTAWKSDAPRPTPKCAFRTILKLRMCFNFKSIRCLSRQTRSSLQKKCRVCASSARKVNSHSSQLYSEATPASSNLMPPHTSGRRLGGPQSQTNSMLDARQSLSSYLSSSNSSNRLLNRKLLAPQFRPSEISPTMLATSSNFSTVKNLTKENSKPKSRRTVQGDLCKCKMSSKRYFPTTNSLK